MSQRHSPLFETALDNEEEEIKRIGGTGFAEKPSNMQVNGISDDELKVLRNASTDELLEFFRQVRPTLEDSVRSDLRKSVDAARPLLEQCGFEPKNERLFQSPMD